MSEIVLDRVSKTWGRTAAVDDVSFTAHSGALLVLLGPSGCGKSTTLRMIAGLEDVSTGRIGIDGRDVTRLPPAKRRISMVFQSYALFPHLDVSENIVFGLRVRGLKRADRTARLARVAELVGLADLLHRRPAQLSGGQRQRVALARAIVAENPICLMDEPLSNLDAKLRHDMRVEIRALQQRLGMTVVYVTHDQTEAMSMADQVILMRDGKIVQAGRPEDLYDRPATTFAAGFIGTPPMNVIDLADGPNGAVIAGTDGPPVLRGQGRGLRLGIRPEHLRLTDGAGLGAEVVSADYLGADTILTTRVGSQTLLLRVPGRCGLRTGQAVRVGWSTADVHIFDGGSGRRLGTERAVSVAA